MEIGCKKRIGFNFSALIESAEREGVSEEKLCALKRCNFILWQEDRQHAYLVEVASVQSKNDGPYEGNLLLYDEEESCTLIVNDEVWVLNFARSWCGFVVHSIERPIEIEIEID